MFFVLFLHFLVYIFAPWILSTGFNIFKNNEKRGERILRDQEEERNPINLTGLLSFRFWILKPVLRRHFGTL